MVVVWHASLPTSLARNSVWEVSGMVQSCERDNIRAKTSREVEFSLANVVAKPLEVNNYKLNNNPTWPLHNPEKNLCFKLYSSIQWYHYLSCLDAFAFQFQCVIELFCLFLLPLFYLWVLLYTLTPSWCCHCTRKVRHCFVTQSSWKNQNQSSLLFHLIFLFVFLAHIT